MRFNHCWRVVTLLLFAHGLLLAQRTSSNISGAVSDPSGAIVVGARVTATELATNAASVAVTNQSVFYVITNLAPGGYTLRV